MGGLLGGSPFHGRDDELAHLHSALGSARATGTAAVLIGGEAGVGKSRLVAEFGDAAVRDGAVVLSGRALDLGDGPSFWPVVSALRDHVRTTSGPAVDRVAAGLDRLEDGDGTARTRVEMLDALRRLVIEAARSGPVVLVLDDLHWADRSTRDLLVYLVASLAAEPVLLVGTYRDDAVGGVPALLGPMMAELRRHRQVSFLRVAPLQREALSTLLTAWAPERPDLEPLVWRHSEGNVFLAEETVRAVLAGDPRGLPSTVRDMVRSGMAGLSPGGQRVVRAVAAGVGDVPHALLADVLTRLGDELADAVREAVEAGFVLVNADGDGYRLRHGLMAEVVETDLLPGERVELHGRYARAIAGGSDRERPGTTARLAHHWQRAEEPQNALDATVAAASESERVRGYAEAYRHWLRAAALSVRAPSAPIPRGRCLERAAEAADLAGDHDEAVALFAQRLSDPDGPSGPDAAVMRARMGRCLVAAGRAREAEHAYRRAVQDLPDNGATDAAAEGAGDGGDGHPDPGADRARADILAGHAAVLLHVAEFAAARDVARQALEPARRAGDPRLVARALSTLGFGSAYLEDSAEGLGALSEAVEVAEATGDPSVVGECLLRRAELLSGPLNALDDGVEAARAGAERMAETGLARTAGVALLASAANGLFRLGRWDEAEDLVAQAWALAPTGAHAIDVRLARARLRMGRGDLDASEDDLEAAELVAPSTVGPRHRLPLLILRAGLEMWRARPDVAFRHVMTGLDVVESGMDDLWSVAPLLWHGARAHAEAAQRSMAPPETEVRRLRRHYREMAERAERSVPAVRTVLDTYVAMCAAEDDRAEGRSDPAAWEAVATRLEGLGQPYPTAYARLRSAEAHLGRRVRSAEGTAALERAERAARALRAGPLLAEVNDLAARARVTFEPAGPGTAAETAEPVAGPLSGLTPREMEVLTVMATGLTNREIAAYLFISEKTVGVHLTRVFAKLGVHSRVQASAMLPRPGAGGSPA